MPTLSEILTKKDYTQKKPSRLFYKDSPAWQKLLTAGFIFLLTCSMMGDGKSIMDRLGALPKAITVGIICMAVGYGFIYPDMERIRKIFKPALIFLVLMAALLLWSMVIWISSFSTVSTMVRACSKITFQSISILTAVAAVYLFGPQAIDLFTISICLANAGIMLLEVPAYGIGPSIQSLITCLVTFGDAQGYARRLEIHDLTFVFGQLILYYAAFAPHSTLPEKKRRICFLILCTFFFLVGMKRIAIPAVILFIFVGLFCKAQKHIKPWVMFIGVGFVIFFPFYIYIVRSGILTAILHLFGVDMMGRDSLWMMANDYYEFSFTYIGHGFEYVDELSNMWFRTGVLKRALLFHNDILKVFVELGAPGFIIWSGLQYIIYPIFWMRFSDEQTALLYICELGYMTITYLTDNTSFYFWSTMALRLIPLCYFVAHLKPAKKQVWRPHDRQEMHNLIYALMQKDPAEEGDLC